jgi:hypothetical protein
MNPIPEIKYLKSFVIYTLIAVVVAAVVGAIQGVILGGILGASGVDIKTIQIITGLTGFIIGSVISFFVFRWIIQTHIIPQIAKHYEIRRQ